MPPANKTMDATSNYIVKIRQQAIQRLALTSRNLGSPPEASNNNTKAWYAQLEELLTWLENDAQMTPDLKERSKIDQGLLLMFDKPDIHFPNETAERAKALYERFERERWGGPEDVDMGDADSGIAMNAPISPVRKRRRDSAAGPANNSQIEAVIKEPPPTHPIWGEDGIMHGVALSVNYKGGDKTRKSSVYDDRYTLQRRSAKVHGHNDIEVGTWYPRQLVSCFHGAHGHQQAGIFGDQSHGAYSIVVSGQYDDLDKDHGDYLYYSAPNSHSNDDPRRPVDPAGGALALHTSLQTGKPVRVLRSHSGKSCFAPSCGLRYDGLYRVVTLNHPKNAKGGMYEQFGLERLDEQPAIDVARPNGQEKHDHEMINRFFPGAR